MLGRYRESLKGDRRHLFDSYRFVEMARKVVGVGSVGTRAWVLLMMGRDGQDPLFMQAKEAEASVLEPYVGASEFGNHGERVVEGQWLMQAASDILLGWLPAIGIDDQERDFYVRQLWDGKRSVDVETLPPEGLAIYGRVCGWTLARAHARSGDRIAIAAYLGKGETLRPGDRRLLRALRRPERARLRALADAAKSGRIEVETDLASALAKPAIERMGGHLGERDAQERSCHDVAGIVHARVYAGVRHQGRERPQGRSRRGGDVSDSGRERKRRGRVPGRKRAGDRHADLAGEGNLLRDPVGAPATAERLGNQVRDGRRDRNRREPDHGRPAAVAPARHCQHGSRGERQARIVGGTREPAHGAVDRRRGRAGDRRVDRDVEALGLVEPARESRSRRASRRACRRRSGPGSGWAMITTSTRSRALAHRSPPQARP